MKFEISKTNHDGILIIKHKHFPDSRGFLNKYYESELLKEINFEVDDIYTTTSHRNVVRGMHHQIGEHGQAKLVTCLAGSFWDVALDLRKDSQKYGKVFKYKLSCGNNESILIPSGFSHGTYSLEDNTVMLSICSGKYIPETESGYSMRSLNLDFYSENAIVSEKDMVLKGF